ncbi:Hypothetical predicted protein [Paramuricea clavata]|uniref:Uncharacterized protein n=1 Tax=Paramuricea clavata TaxID=317549 RepID=A0A6S7IZW7_PARCT|nr:Hypothetical predicted protein [Paramuricea clavata]
MDEVIKLICHILPQLSPEVLENTQDKLVEIGVGDVIDLQHLEENDLTLVLRPIQIRKLLQHFKAVKNLILESLRSPSSSKDNSITTPANLNESLGSSSSSSRSSPMLFGDTDTQSDVDDISKTKCTAKPCTYWINDYKIPWNMFSKTLLEACTRKARPKPRERREMIRILCDDIRGFAAVPGRKNLSRIAQMMVAKYKDSFCDVIGDSVIGSGHESLLRQMEERIANLNRKVGKPAAKLSISSDDEDSEPKSKSRKTVIHDSYGCVNWQPESLPTDETTDTQESKQDWLMEEFRKKEQDRKKVLLFMENTYTSQRLVINRNNPDSPIGEVKDKWPFLFEKECMFLHFEQLMGFKIQDVMQASLASKAKIIVEYLRQNHIQKKKIKQVLWRIEAAMSSKKDQQPVMIGVFLLLLAYFEEKQELMIRSDVDETVSNEEILKQCPKSPFLVIFDETLLANRCSLVVDGIIVNEKLVGFIEGLMVMFASYYIFNIVYPEELASTLEFIQRCFLGLNPEKGSKRSKTKGKKNNVNPKVLSLANSLKDFQSQWTI